jgi:hypothetical protein
MRQQEFEKAFFSESFDKLSVFDVRVLRSQVEKTLSEKVELCDAQLMHRASSVYRKERGDSRVCKKDLKVFKDTCRLFFDVFHPFFEEKYSRNPNLDESFIACRKAFSKLMPDRYVETVVSVHRLRHYFKLWGYMDSHVDVKVGRKSYDEILSRTGVEETVDACLNKYFVDKGYLHGEQKRSELEVLKSLMTKLETSDMFSKSDKVSLCCEFLEHLKSEYFSELLLLPKDRIQTIAEQWIVAAK